MNATEKKIMLEITELLENCGGCEYNVTVGNNLKRCKKCVNFKKMNNKRIILENLQKAKRKERERLKRKEYYLSRRAGK